jgi:nucleotide exchange factor SIL1
MRASRLIGVCIVAACALSSTGLEAGAAGGDVDLGLGLVGRAEPDLLKWALAHSDPEALRDHADAARRERHRDGDAAERSARVAELLGAVAAAPTPTTLMQGALSVLGGAAANPADKLRALEALRQLVEPIDDAMDLHKLGGTAALLALLGGGGGDGGDAGGGGDGAALAAGAARALATAASNNNAFQEQLLQGHAEVMHGLARMAARASENADDGGAAAALHAAGAVLRNSDEGRRLWAHAGGEAILTSLAGAGGDALPRAQLRALALCTDLVAVAGGGVDAAAVTPPVLRLLQRAANVDLNLNLLEKALLAAHALDGLPAGRRALLDGEAAGGAARLAAALRQRAAIAGAEHADHFADLIALAEQLASGVTPAAHAEL